MTRNGYVGTVIRREDAVKDPLRPDSLVCTSLAVESYPQLIILCETRLDPVAREKVVDVGLITASIACVSANTFAEILLDLGYERMPGRQIKAIEGIICGLKTPCQGTCVVALRCGNLLILNLRSPKLIDSQSLGNSQLR